MFFMCILNFRTVRLSKSNFSSDSQSKLSDLFLQDFKKEETGHLLVSLADLEQKVFHDPGVVKRDNSQCIFARIMSLIMPLYL